MTFELESTAATPHASPPSHLPVMKLDSRALRPAVCARRRPAHAAAGAGDGTASRFASAGGSQRGGVSPAGDALVLGFGICSRRRLAAWRRDPQATPLSCALRCESAAAKAGLVG
eukprot:28515-Chlamydomonas_euryale.AAC.2